MVAVTVADFADSPASPTALTWKPYAVEGVRRVTVVEVPVTVASLVPSRWTPQPVAPGTGDQDRATLEEVTEPALSPVGGAGGRPVSPPGPVREMSSAW